MQTFTINKQLKIYQNSVMQNNTIVYTQDDTVYIIDPSFQAAELYQQYNDFKHKFIILTHSHYDHIGDVEKLSQWADTIYVSSAVKKHKKEMQNQVFFDHQLLTWDKVQYVDNKEKINNIQCFHTPGHSADSMCLLIGDVLISGDHIFYTAIGRTDLPTSNPQQMHESILYFKKILDDYHVKMIIPGHGKYCSKDELLTVNFYLQTN